VHMFFLIAQTKMVAYTMVLLPIYMLAIGHALSQLRQHIPSRFGPSWMYGVLLVVLSFFTFDPTRIIAKHTVPEDPSDKQLWRKQQIMSTQSMSDLKALLEAPGPKAVFNYPMTYHLEFMFIYRIPTWHKFPSAEDALRLQEKGYTVYALQDGHPLEQFPRNVLVIPDSVLALPRIRRL
jgi:hypothetical protein